MDISGISLIIITFFFSFALMEGVAWLTHKYIMHGLLWVLHHDHHLPRSKKSVSFFEKNDWFFIIFAAPSASLYIFGSILANNIMFAAAIGISLYGIAYFVFHEIIFHRRFNILTKWRPLYIRALRRAHAAHHVNRGRENGRSFGLLIFSYKFIKLEIEKNKK